jgi:hypothetical protein
MCRSAHLWIYFLGENDFSVGITNDNDLKRNKGEVASNGMMANRSFITTQQLIQKLLVS